MKVRSILMENSQELVHYITQTTHYATRANGKKTSFTVKEFCVTLKEIIHYQLDNQTKKKSQVKNHQAGHLKAV